MLKHPTLDRLRELGLEAWQRGFRDLAAIPEKRRPRKHRAEIGSVCWLTRGGHVAWPKKRFRGTHTPPPKARKSRHRRGCRLPASPVGPSTGRCSCTWPSCDWIARSARPDSRRLRTGKKAFNCLRIGAGLAAEKSLVLLPALSAPFGADGWRVAMAATARLMPQRFARVNTCSILGNDWGTRAH